ncbi:Cell division cycle 5-like protein [Camellia lanceoleosa]|uniref:Cell division cycle 5-like protein n=1 Tax=Camellia lanceoleosa TaxID=1840588 RepID=A0ACC0IIW4_9ERIC|nr:Cell division cycle 5-like protein [Camellia lanceoleosa]
MDQNGLTAGLQSVLVFHANLSRNERNYLTLAHVQLPLEDAENDARHYNDDQSDFGRFGYTNDKAGYFIKEEFQFLKPLGHENESLDEFVEAHKTCLNDIMYFPTRNGYGLSSVAGNIEKLAALQNEFENVKKRMDDDTKKAQRLEQKIKLLTNGYQMDIVNDRDLARKPWSQIGATFKQMDTAEQNSSAFKLCKSKSGGEIT